METSKRFFEEFLNRTSLLDTHSLMISWLIDQPDIDLEMKNEKGKTLLEIISGKVTKNARWPLIIKLLEKGASLDAKTKSLLFNEALKQKKLSAAHFLLNEAIQHKEYQGESLGAKTRSLNKEYSIKTLIDGISYESLKAILDSNNQGWAQSVVDLLCANGLNLNLLSNEKGNSLLFHAIQAKNYSMAAFLISKGSELDKKTIQRLEIDEMDPEILLNYANTLKKGSLAQQALCRELFIKNLGHLLGDSFLKKMKSIEGTTLEGNYPSVSLSFMSRILDLINEQKINISIQTKEKLKELSLQFRQTIPLSLAIEEIIRMNPNSSQLAVAIEKVSDSIRKDLKNLKPGDQLLIPHGWTASPMGHATMIVCRRALNGFVFDLINTGAGVQYHLSQKDSAKIYIDTVHSFFISEKVIEKTPLIEQILAPKLLGGGTADHRDRRFDESDLYVVLQPYSMTDQQREEIDIPLNSAWMGTQLTGTCSFRCPEAVLASAMEIKEYKILIPFIKELVLTLAFDLNEELIQFNPPLAKIMSESAPRFFTHVAKHIKRLPSSERTETLLKEKTEDLERLEKFHKGLKEKLPSRISSNPPLPCSDQFPTETKKVSQGLVSSKESEHTMSIKSEKIKAVPLPSFDFSQIDTAEQLAEVLSSYASYVQKMKDKNISIEHSTAIFLRNLGRLFTANQEEKKIVLFSSLEKNPDACLKALHDLESISASYFDKNGNLQVDGSRLIALSSALAVGWSLCKAIDKQSGTQGMCSLDSYRLDHSFFLTKVYYEQINLIHSPELCEDWVDLYIFMVNSGKKENAVLFQFNEHGQVSDNSFHSEYNRVYLKEKTGDYKYAEAYHSTMPSEAWSNSNAIYEEQIKKYPYHEKANQTLWRVTWLYVHGQLPEHFLSLRHIALLAHIESPYRDTRKRSSMFEFGGPFLVPEVNTKEKKLTVNFSVDGKERIGKQAFLLLKPERKKYNFFLPQKKGKAQYYPDTGISNFPCIDPRYQNTILTTIAKGYHDLCTLRTLYSDSQSPIDIPFTMLIDYFENHLEELAKPEYRVIFHSCINQFLKLRKIDSSLRWEFIDFFNQAIDHFYTLALTEGDKEQNIQALLFLYEQKQQVLRYLIIPERNEEFIATLRKELKNTRQEIQKLRSFPNCINPNDQQYLCLIYLDSLNEERDLTGEEVLEIIKLRADLACQLLDHPKNPKLFPSLWHSAKLSSVVHKESIQKFLRENPQQIDPLLNEIFEKLNVNVQDAKWEVEGFPLYSCMIKDSYYQFNVLTGEALKNGIAFSSMESISKQRLYQELFGDNFIVGTKTSNGIESQDKHGNIRLIIGKDNWDQTELKAVQREIDQQWFQYISPSSSTYPLLPPLPERDTLQVWKSVENENPYYILVDKKTMAPKYVLDGDGYFHFPYGKDSKRYEWINLSNVKEMKGAIHFDSRAFLWKSAPKNTMDDYPALLTFPSYKDEQGNLLNFQLKNNQWVSVSSPHLHISQDQSLQEISFFSRFLVVEDDLGGKEVFLPLQTLGQMEQQTFNACICQKLQLENGQAFSKKPAKNAFLAYLTMAHAITPQDYIIAMDYLKKAFSFERYTPEELRIFGWIFNIVKEKPDYRGSMDSIRLYAAWLVQDNLKRNPLLEEATSQRKHSNASIPNLYADPKDWEAYWNNEWTWTKKGNNYNLTSQLNKLTRHYLPRNASVPYQVKLENILEPQELINWGFDRRTIGYTSITPPSQLPKEQGNLEIMNLNLFKTEPPQTPLSFQMRPGKQFASQFPHLYQLAKSSKASDRQKVHNIISSMAYDAFENNRALRLILQAALIVYSGDKNQRSYQDAFLIVDLMDEILVAVSYNTSHVMDQKLIENQSLLRLNRLLVSLDSHLGSKRLIGGQIRKQDVRKPTIIIPPHEALTLPKEPPKIDKLTYKHPGNDLEEINQIYTHFFDTLKSPSTASQVSLFEFKSNDEFMNEGIHQLNQDYIEGNKKNDATLIHALKQNLEPQKALKDIKNQLESIQDISQKQANALKREINELANKPPENLEKRVLEKAAILAGLKPTLEENDWKALFLLGDVNEFKKMTHLTNEKEIHHLYQKIGEYFSLSRKLNHIEGLLKEIAYAEKQQEDIKPSLQKIGNGLIQVRYVDPSVDPNALIVFEHGLKLFLKKDQVEGLRQMIPSGEQTTFPNILLQRIQGGGKTLIFGHSLALLKANGFNLSIHVVPAPLYGTALYDMQHISGKVLGQKERTFEFDDNPQRFTEEYLTWMLDMMIRVVVNREYITVTNETLRAMRCKYIKTSLQINLKLANSNGIETDEITEIEHCNDILQEMLKIMKEIGVFTFEEVHQAFDPTIELNMPFGKIIPILLAAAHWIGKIIAFSAHSGENQQHLLLLHENHQSQQTEEQYESMISEIINKLIPEIQAELDLTDNVFEREQLHDYLSGNEKKNLPHFIANKGKEKATLIVLAKQMLAGKWLKERLNKSINEHLGFSKNQQGPRIAIPYRGNENPSEGSEFSDEYVMIINTLMTYLVEGLTEDQLKEFIEDLKKQAYRERLIKKEENPSFSLRDTKAAQQFLKVCSMDLFLINKENRSTLEKINQSLLGYNDDATLLLFNYVISHEFPKVELYEHQVCSQGRNTASMAKSIIGYSGSIDNENLAPPGTTILPEIGTNGQTVDLFIKQNDEWWVIDSDKPKEYSSLFTDFLEKHPDSLDFKAIIAVGAYFAGRPNQKVAEMICQFLNKQNSPLAGVLFYDPSGSLCFMNKNQTAHPIKLSGTLPEIIQKETGYSEDFLFTYYDQNHITGADIKQSKKAKGVIIWSEHTEFHNAIQGARRFRELANEQRLVSVVEKGALNKIGSKIQKSSLEQLKMGKVDSKKHSIKDLLLFSYLMEKEQERKNNLLFCLQDLINPLQQHILDLAYSSSKEDRRKLFEQTNYLFIKTVTKDLYDEYAYEQENMPIEKYLTIIQKRLISPLSSILPSNDIQKLQKETSNTISKYLKGLQKTIEVKRNFGNEKEFAFYGSQEGTTTQYREQKQTSEKQTEKVQEKESQNVTFTNNELKICKTNKQANEINISLEYVENPDYIQKPSLYTGQNGCLNTSNMIGDLYFNPSTKSIEGSNKKSKMEIWALSQVLGSVEGKEYETLFDADILMTSNFAITWQNRIDILGGFAKTSFQWLLVCDEKNETKNWKIIFLSVKDAANLSEKWNDAKLPEGRSMYLLRAFSPVKCMKSIGKEFDSKIIFEDQKVRSLITQALFFCGKLQAFNNKKWCEALDAILPKGQEREIYRKFFEERILRGTPLSYIESPLYEILNKKVGSEISRKNFETK